MTPSDTIARAAKRAPKGFYFTLSSTMLLGILMSIWHFTTKVSLAENQTETNKTQIVILASKVDKQTNIITAVDKAQAVMQSDIKYIMLTMDELKTDQRARDIEQRIRDEKIMQKLESLKK